MKPREYVIAPWVVVDQFHDDNGSVRFWTDPHLTAARDVSCDGMGREILRALEKGATVHSLSQATGLPPRQIDDLLEDLVREGIVCERTSFPPELQRYSRHMLFYQILGMDPVTAQQRLASARVIVLGLGGIGTNVSLGLITAGIGDLTIVDDDIVEEVNLPRQVLYHDADIGRLKVVAARERLLQLRQGAVIRAIQAAPDNVEGIRELSEAADVLILSAERPANIFDIVDKACLTTGVAYCGIGYYNARLFAGPLRVPGKTGCFRCNEDRTEPRQAAFPHVTIAPSLGPLNSMISSVAVFEVLRYLTSGGSALLNRQLEYDALSGAHRYVAFPRNPRCERCSERF